MESKVTSQPLVTVVIASYNHEAYIADSINSVLRQTYKNVELIVIDDGSTDGSVPIIQGLKEQHGFEFEVQSNAGLSATLNKAIAKSRGQYFVPFGSDDIMLNDRLEKQVAYMGANRHLAVCGGNILKINESGKVLEKQKTNPETELDFDDIFLDKKPGLPAPTLFFKRDVLNEVGGFDPDIRLEDLYIQLAISKKGYRLGYLTDILAYYRVHSHNTYKNLKFMHDNVIETYQKFRDDPNYETVKNKFLNSLLIKAVKTDKQYGFEVLKEIPLRAYNLKTIRGILKLITP